MVAILLKAVSFVTSNFKAILITLAILTILFFVIGFFYLRGELSDAQTALAAAKAQVTQLQKDITDIRTAHNDLAKKTVELEKKKEELVAQLERRGKKSISELARKHATLVEKAINNGTEKALKCIEAVSKGGEC